MTKTILNKLLIAAIFFAGCTDVEKPSSKVAEPETVRPTTPVIDSPVYKLESPLIPTATIETGIITPAEVLAFAKTLIGTPYLYASTDPANGFDCSGFITYVFNHFNIAVPRSSIDFTHVGKEVEYKNAGPGDLILFTGTDSTIKIVGHMGIVESNKADSLHFLHSTSGKAKGVVITPFENYYKSRFVKVIRIFPDASFQ
ncbi:MAG: C40 family peptidase [Bacteroidota bacterium]|nr:C40 family peptidase [Bacteroidota bacterium]